MSPLGAAINFAIVFAAVAFWHSRRKRKGRAHESAPLPPEPAPTVHADPARICDQAFDADDARGGGHRCGREAPYGQGSEQQAGFAGGQHPPSQNRAERAAGGQHDRVDRVVASAEMLGGELE